MGRLVQTLNFEVQVLGLLCICGGCITCFKILFKRTFLRVHFHVEMYISLSVRTVKKSIWLPQIVIHLSILSIPCLPLCAVDETLKQ